MVEDEVRELLNQSVELLGAIYVQLTRIYDVLAVVYSSSEGMSELIEMHAAGKVITPDPLLVSDTE